MSTPTASWGSSISHHLHAAKGILKSAIFGVKYVRSDEMRRVWETEISVDGTATRPGQTEVSRTRKRAHGLRLTHVVFQFNVIEKDALDILQLIRSWRNSVAPINQIPPEILTLVPDFWDKHDGRDKDVIVMTHVCRAWREVFVSRSSLWTNLECVDLDKTRVYFERSKDSPIDLSLVKDDVVSPGDSFFQIIPHAIGQLRSLTIDGTPKNLEHITARLSRPAPLLEELSVCAFREGSPHRHPALTSALFDGDLSSLRKLRLDYVRTELPWRNMINLTSFMLARAAPGERTVEQLLDFFENAPNLLKIDLYSAISTSGPRDGRLVSLARLKWMHTVGGGPPSLLLDHLLIPVGARLVIEVESPSPLIDDRPPGFFDNLRNLADFTSIRILGGKSHPYVQFGGPNGGFRMVLGASRVDTIHIVLGSLAQFETSKTECLELVGGSPLSSNPLHRALLPMNNLRTLTIHGCRNPHIFIRALHPGVSTSRVVVCPKLEELVLNLNIDGEEFDIQSVIRMAKARASRGAKLGSVRIIDGNPRPKVDPAGVLELRAHAWCVEYGP